VLAASALTGLPPFSIVATAAGLLAIRVRAFAAIVLAGRGLRFAIVIAVTLLAR
jgi:membrane protein YqaA with SNARE-associated domain